MLVGDTPTPRQWGTAPLHSPFKGLREPPYELCKGLHGEKGSDCLRGNEGGVQECLGVVKLLISVLIWSHSVSFLS